MSKKLKLSPWFDGNTKPHRAGVYKAKFKYPDGTSSGVGFCHYSKSLGGWGWLHDTYESAKNDPNPWMAEQNKQWRGVLK